MVALAAQLAFVFTASYIATTCPELTKQQKSRPEACLEGCKKLHGCENLGKGCSKRSPQQGALRQAERADREFRRGIDRGPLQGIPWGAKDLLAVRGFDPVLGARPLRRTVQREIEDALAETMLYGEVGPGQIVLVDVEGEGPTATFSFEGKPCL